LNSHRQFDTNNIISMEFTNESITDISLSGSDMDTSDTESIQSIDPEPEPEPVCEESDKESESEDDMVLRARKIDKVVEDIDDLYCFITETVAMSVDDHVVEFFRHKFRDMIRIETIEGIHLAMNPADLEGIEDMIDDMVDDVLDLQFDTLPSYKEPHVPTRIDANPSAIERAKTIPQVAQKSEEWYKQRQNMMTASNMWKIIKSDAMRNSFIFEKCKAEQNQFYSTSTNWGNKYEPVSTMLYEKMFGVKVDEFGCIPHREYAMIGASPDGIVTDTESPLYGRMLEIKNIYNREITGTPKEEYWVQMQIQLEVCDLDACDFLETRFKEYSDEEFYNDDTDRIRGVIAESIDGPSYYPLDAPKTPEAISQWLEKIDNASLSYYYLDEYSCVTVRRNREWFDRALPSFLETWETILRERTEGYEHRAPKPREKKQVQVVKDLEVNMAEINRVANELSKQWDVIKFD